jgi:opine dehydrogenase
MVNIACMANGADYWNTGRTVEKLGLGAMNARQMVRYAVTGELDMTMV